MFTANTIEITLDKHYWEIPNRQNSRIISRINYSQNLNVGSEFITVFKTTECTQPGHVIAIVGFQNILFIPMFDKIRVCI